MRLFVRAAIVVLGTWLFGAGAPGVCCAQESPASQEDNQPQAPAVDAQLAQRLNSPRETMRTFLAAVNEGRRQQAIECLELSGAALTGETANWDYAYNLKDVIDRLVRVDLDEAPADSERRTPWRLSELAGLDRGEREIADQIEIVRGGDGLWRFSAATVASVNNLLPLVEDRERVAGAEPAGGKPLSRVLRDAFPRDLRTTHFLLPDYQWICLLALIFLGFAADLLARLLLRYLTAAWFKYVRKETGGEAEKDLWRPMGLLAQALVWYAGTSAIGLPPLVLTILLVGLKFFAVVAAVWTSFRLIDLLAAYLARKALKTDTRFDDLLVPLISKSLKVFAVCVGVLMCAEAFNLPIAGLLGGLGIGGAALAFASKDAISNVFGSVTVLVDRPFEIGDWIVTESVEGTVEAVGFRSTRIRTFYNSLVTLPNSRLTTAVVDNMGKRRYRRVKATLGVQYDTTPQQIDAFCEGVRELLRRHPYTRKDYYHVYFNGFGASSLDILLYCFLECPDWSIELREKHRLFSDILQLAHRLGVSFAFPTRTLHMFQEQHGDAPGGELADPEAAGQRLAARIAGPPPAPDQRPGGVEFRGPSQVEDGDAAGEQ